MYSVTARSPLYYLLPSTNVFGKKLSEKKKKIESVNFIRKFHLNQDSKTRKRVYLFLKVLF